MFTRQLSALLFIVQKLFLETKDLMFELQRAQNSVAGFFNLLYLVLFTFRVVLQVSQSLSNIN